MKLDLFDPYIVRARLSPGVIFLSPAAITLFFCFPEIYSLTSSSILIAVFISFTNYLPILQRQICQHRIKQENYAARFLLPDDKTINEVIKKRYYKIISEIDQTFSFFKTIKYNDEQEKNIFYQNCEMVVRYLRTNTRSYHLLLEENINYGFYRNLYSVKNSGIVLCVIFGLIAVGHLLFCFITSHQIPVGNCQAFVYDILMLIFWTLGVKQGMLEATAKSYARALLSTIDLLPKNTR